MIHTMKCPYKCILDDLINTINAAIKVATYGTQQSKQLKIDSEKQKNKGNHAIHSTKYGDCRMALLFGNVSISESSKNKLTMSDHRY